MLVDSLLKAGYTALPANEIFKLDERKKNQRLMLWRVLVAWVLYDASHDVCLSRLYLR